MIRQSPAGRFSSGSARRPSGQAEIRALGGLERFRDQRVLEVGTGDGRLVFAYGAVAKSVTAIDPNGEAIDRATLRAHELDWEHVEFIATPAQDLDVRKRFDLALLAWSL